MIPYEGIDLDFSLAGKTAVITGGAAGIGYATAEFFHEKGANLILSDINPDIGKIAKKLGGNCISVHGDVCDAEHPKKVIEAGVAAFGKIDILINNAGVGVIAPAEIYSAEDWNNTIAINLSACFFMAQAVGNHMIEHGVKGSIVNVASQASVIALDKHVAYCASKAGLIAITQVLALEWGKYGIRTNAVSPTVVLTELGRGSWDNPVGDAFKKELPAERFAEPDEVAACIGFLCSKAAGMITGHNLLIDGGYTAK